MKYNIILDIFIRYIILIAVGISNILFYIFSPITIGTVYFILNLFYQVTLISNSLIINGYEISLIEACIASSAYFLLLILNLTTPMQIKKRLYVLVYIFAIFFIINIIRIIIFSILFINKFPYFDFTHQIFWYFISTILVILIWFSAVKLFKIKQIPIYNDILSIKNMKR